MVKNGPPPEHIGRWYDDSPSSWDDSGHFGVLWGLGPESWFEGIVLVVATAAIGMLGALIGYASDVTLWVTVPVAVLAGYFGTLLYVRNQP